jgi:hypothetical protein
MRRQLPLVAPNGHADPIERCPLLGCQSGKHLLAASIAPVDLSGLEQTVKSVGQDSIRILPVVYASESELVARRAGVARSPLRAVTCNWKPIASSTLRTVLKFGCFGLPAKAR